MPRLRNSAYAPLCTALAGITLVTGGLMASTPVHAMGADIPDVGIDQRLDTQLPLDLVFRDESGEQITLGSILDGGKPAILALVYYDCTMLCGEVLNGMLDTFQELDLTVGSDFEVITISFDPTETYAVAAPKKQIFVNAYGREEAEEGWHFLTNEGDSAKKLADLVGFRYSYLPDIDEYAHGSAIILITPSGKVSRYFYGIAYPPRDVRFALLEAGEGKIGTLADQLMLLCMYYNPESGVYTIAVMRILQIAGSATALMLASFVFVLFMRERWHRVHPVVCES